MKLMIGISLAIAGGTLTVAGLLQFLTLACAEGAGACALVSMGLGILLLWLAAFPEFWRKP